MKSLHIRNIAPDTLQALKRLSTMHHRSLQGELHHILEKAARKGSEDALELITVDTGKEASFTREDMYDDNSR